MASTAPKSTERWGGVVIAAAVAVPAILLILAEAVVMVGAAFTGTNLRVPNVVLNLSEAVAVRDGAEMMRLLERGDDPNTRRLVREGLLEGRAVEATPLEAAISIRRSELIGLLYANGAAPDAASWQRLVCYAEQQNFDDVAEVLMAHRPSGVETMCTGNETLW